MANQVPTFACAGWIVGVRPRRPVAPRSRAAGGSNLRLDGQHFRSVGSDTPLETPGYAAVTDRYDVTILGGNELTVATD